MVKESDTVIKKLKGKVFLNKEGNQNRNSIDYFGLVGIILWYLTYLVRKTGWVTTYSFLSLFWNVPNLAFAWVLTAMLKQLYQPAFSKTPLITTPLTIKKYFYICLLVVIGAVMNEVIFSVFQEIAVDRDDLLATLIAQVTIFIIPVLRKEIY